MFHGGGGAKGMGGKRHGGQKTGGQKAGGQKAWGAKGRGAKDRGAKDRGAKDRGAKDRGAKVLEPMYRGFFREIKSNARKETLPLSFSHLPLSSVSTTGETMEIVLNCLVLHI